MNTYVLMISLYTKLIRDFTLKIIQHINIMELSIFPIC